MSKHQYFAKNLIKWSLKVLTKSRSKIFDENNFESFFWRRLVIGVKSM